MSSEADADAVFEQDRSSTLRTQSSPFDPSFIASTMSGSPGTSMVTAGSVSSSGTGCHPPVLYSAIGSLEDPTNSSFGKWEQQQKPTMKFEFPSSVMLPPLNQAKNLAQKKKWRNF